MTFVLTITTIAICAISQLAVPGYQTFDLCDAAGKRQVASADGLDVLGLMQGRGKLHLELSMRWVKFAPYGGKMVSALTLRTACLYQSFLHPSSGRLIGAFGIASHAQPPR